MQPLKALLPIALVLSGGALTATAAQAQFGGIGSVVKALPVKSPAVPNLLSGPAPVSTSIKDAVFGDPGTDGFTPPGPARDLILRGRARRRR